MSERIGIYIGFDPREASAFAVARHSIRRKAAGPLPIFGIVLSDMVQRGLYTRETEIRSGHWTGADGKDWFSTEPVLWDARSQWTMSTEFAISRFLTPIVASEGWAMFLDCDVLVRKSISPLFQYPFLSKFSKFAVLCVKHDHRVSEDSSKMEGQIQTNYSRKNWSSVVMFNCDHPANKRLTVEMVNTLPGRDLHRFCWLEDHEIGELPARFNWLVGHSDPSIDPDIVHFTDGIPSMKGYENVPFAQEWKNTLADWAS